jgi:hypothetical protein
MERSEVMTMNDEFSLDGSTSVELGELPFSIETRLETARQRFVGGLSGPERRMKIMEARGGLVPTMIGDSPLLDMDDLDSSQSGTLPDNVEVLSGDPPKEAIEVARENAGNYRQVVIRQTDGQQTSDRIADSEPMTIVEGETHGISDSVTLFKREVGKPAPETNASPNPRHGAENSGSSPSGPPSMRQAADQKFR